MTYTEKVLRAAHAYKSACRRVQPAWIAFLHTPVNTPERRAAQREYLATMQAARDARTELLDVSADGGSEVPT